MRRRLTATVIGRVQGVYFRSSTQGEAARRDLRGWVANRSDGSVMVVAEGEEEELRSLERWLHHGPSAARVDEVDVIWSEATGEFLRFTVR